MPIHHRTGDLFASHATALVNPVNTDGVMGAGLALAFKRRYPAAFDAYRIACQEGRMRLGEVHLWRNVAAVGPRLIAHLPTKDHWRDLSDRAYVEAGLVALRAALEERRVPSVAIPALGCGLGQLPWALVRWLLEGVFAGTAMDVELYEPTGPHAGIEAGRVGRRKGPCRRRATEEDVTA